MRSLAREKAALVDVVLVSVGDTRIDVIKKVRELTSLGLKEAKELVESAPVTIVRAISMTEAEAIRAGLARAGARVKLEPVRTTFKPDEP